VYTYFKLTDKQCILRQFHTTALFVFPQKPYTLAGFEPGLSIPEVDAISNEPRRQGGYLKHQRRLETI
jgi:hypothetical protein